MRIVKKKKKVKIRLKKKKPPYEAEDALLEVLMFLPDQKVRGLASDAIADPSLRKKAARLALAAAKKLNWEHWQARAKLAEIGGGDDC